MGGEDLPKQFATLPHCQCSLSSSTSKDFAYGKLAGSFGKDDRVTMTDCGNEAVAAERCCGR